MKRKSMILGLVALSTFFWGCPKRAPKTPAEDLSTKTSTVAPQPEEVTAAPAPSSSADRTPDPLSGDLAQVNSYAQSQGLLGDVYFDFDKSDLRAEARERLAKNAEWLAAHPEFTVTLEGHCDERGTNEYNLALGERRASAARDYLQFARRGGEPAAHHQLRRRAPVLHPERRELLVAESPGSLRDHRPHEGWLSE